MTSIQEFVEERKEKIASSTVAVILVALGHNTHPIFLGPPLTDDPWAEVDKLLAAGGRPIGVAGWLNAPPRLEVFIEILPELRCEFWPKWHMIHFVEWIHRTLREQRGIHCGKPELN